MRQSPRLDDALQQPSVLVRAANVAPPASCLAAEHWYPPDTVEEEPASGSEDHARHDAARRFRRLTYFRFRSLFGLYCLQIWL